MWVTCLHCAHACVNLAWSTRPSHFWLRSRMLFITLWRSRTYNWSCCRSTKRIWRRATPAWSQKWTHRDRDDHYGSKLACNNSLTIPFPVLIRGHAIDSGNISGGKGGSRWSVNSSAKISCQRYGELLSNLLPKGLPKQSENLLLITSGLLRSET